MDEDLGLMDYKFRFYSPTLGRFILPDNVVPNPANPQHYNRYSYVNNRPINFNDPTGHFADVLLDIGFIAYDIYDISQNGLNWTNGLSLAADVAGAFIPVVTGGGAVVRAVSKADDVIDVVKNSDIIAKLPTQIHHFATNKSKKFTTFLNDVVEKYGLDLDGPWNKAPMPHQGRHPDKYHSWVLDQINKIDDMIDCRKNCKEYAEQFVSEFKDRVIKPVLAKPEMLRKTFWSLME